MPENHIQREPVRRNTAPCIAYVSWRIKAENPQANIVVSPSDHIVMDVREFQRVIKSALSFTAESDSIVTLGMKPTRPETGYGYIQADLSMGCPRNREIYRVDTFHEKPDLETARKYMSRNNYFWNSGLFLFRVTTIVNALRIYQPELSRIFEDLLPIYGTPQEQEAINDHFPECPSISIDYAVMEKADEIFVFPASFGWSDLGTWGSLRDQSVADANNNVCIGQNIQLYETSNCIVHTMGERKVVVQGLDGYIVAEQDGQLLICRLSEEQRISKF
jgi:mannose-1-phosphate guanylyltransferase